MEEIRIHSESIKLGQALKLAGAVDSGYEAKLMITNGVVKVNGVVEYQRGKKLYDGDVIEYDEVEYKITR